MMTTLVVSKLVMVGGMRLAVRRMITRRSVVRIAPEFDFTGMVRCWIRLGVPITSILAGLSCKLSVRYAFLRSSALFEVSGLFGGKLLFPCRTVSMTRLLSLATTLGKK